MIPNLGPADLLEAALLLLDDNEWRQVDTANTDMDEQIRADPLLAAWNERIFGGV